MRGLRVKVEANLSRQGFGFSTDPVMRRAALATAEWAEEQLRAISPRRTGTLAANWKATVKGTTLVLRNDTLYAGFVEYGTKKMSPRPMATVIAPQARDYYLRQVGKSFVKRR